MDNRWAQKVPTLPLTFGLVVAGQLVMAAVMDHFGLFGISVQPVNWLYLTGIVLIIGGTTLIRLF